MAERLSDRVPGQAWAEGPWMCGQIPRQWSYCPSAASFRGWEAGASDQSGSGRSRGLWQRQLPEPHLPGHSGRGASGRGTACPFPLQACKQPVFSPFRGGALLGGCICLMFRVLRRRTGTRPAAETAVEGGEDWRGCGEYPETEGGGDRRGCKGYPETEGGGDRRGCKGYPEMKGGGDRRDCGGHPEMKGEGAAWPLRGIQISSALVSSSA